MVIRFSAGSLIPLGVVVFLAGGVLQSGLVANIAVMLLQMLGFAVMGIGLIIAVLGLIKWLSGRKAG